MSQNKVMGSSPISPTNKEIANILNLNLIQVAKLSAFSPKVIDYALDKLKSENNIEGDAFKFVYKLCLDYSVSKNINPDFKWASQIIEYTKKQIAKG
jgi:hypothetical protein